MGRKIEGSALITALAFTAVASILVAGVGTYAVSTFSRTETEAKYASSVDVADAGINAMIRRISMDPTDNTLANPANNPLTGSVTGVGTYSVYVQDYNTGGAWTAPNDMLVVSTGTVDGVSRKISVRGARKSIFDEYAIFMDEGGTLGGAGNNGGSTQINGNVGTNGNVTFNGNLGSGAVTGELTLNDGATSNSNGPNVATSPGRVELPTVDEIVNLTFPGGWSYISANNSNAKIMKLSSTNKSLSQISTINGLTLAQATLGDGACLFTSAGFTANSRTFADPNNQVDDSTNANDQSTAAANVRRFATATAGDGIFAKRTYFLPPGDYYFENLDFNSTNSAIVMLTHLGRIRIWVNDPQNRPSIGGNGDRLSCTVIFTDQTPSKFRLFYNKCTTMNLNGSSTFRGGFYAVKPSCTSGPTMDFSGNSTVYGSVISSYISLSGGTQIIFPNDGSGSDQSDFSLWFGTKNEWKELPLNNGGSVFVSGTPQ